MNFIQALRHRAELQPGVPAIVDRTFFGDRVLTYAALNRSVDFLALRLDEEGIKKGDQVLMLLDPSQELYLFLLALLQIGAVPTLCDALTGLKPFGQWVEQCQPAACILPQSKWLAQRFHRLTAPGPSQRAGHRADSKSHRGELKCRNFPAGHRQHRQQRPHQNRGQSDQRGSTGCHQTYHSPRRNSASKGAPESGSLRRRGDPE